MSSNIEELAKRCDCLKCICKIAEANGEQYFYDCQRDIECEDCDMFIYKNNFDRDTYEKLFNLLGRIGKLSYEYKGRYHVFSLNGIKYSNTDMQEAICGLCIKLWDKLYISDFKEALKRILN